MLPGTTHPCSVPAEVQDVACRGLGLSDDGALQRGGDQHHSLGPLCAKTTGDNQELVARRWHRTGIVGRAVGNPRHDVGGHENVVLVVGCGSQIASDDSVVESGDRVT